MNKYLHKKLLLPLFLPACLISSWLSDYIVNFSSTHINNEVKENLIVKKSHSQLTQEIDIYKYNNKTTNPALFNNISLDLNLFQIINLTFIFLLLKSLSSGGPYYLFLNKIHIKEKINNFNKKQRNQEKIQLKIHILITSLKKTCFSQYYFRTRDSH